MHMQLIFVHTLRISGLLLVTTKPLSRDLFCYEGQSSSVLGSGIVIKGKVHFWRELESPVSAEDDQYL